MQTITSKLTGKYQATVPKTIREKLNLNAGDIIEFKMEDDSIILKKARPVDIDFISDLVPIKLISNILFIIRWRSKTSECFFYKSGHENGSSIFQIRTNDLNADRQST